MKTQRVYLIGAGVIAHKHAKAALGLPDADVELHVADPNAAALGAFVEAFPRARASRDAGEMLAAPARDDDVVVVATPPFTHADLAARALGSGRHVLCEKPLALDVDSARHMLRVARRVGRRLGCCSNRFTGYPATGRVRAMVTSGELGRVYQATWVHLHARGRSGIEYQPASRWFLERARSGGGALIDWGVYDLATLFEALEPWRVDVLDAVVAQPQTAVDLPPGVVFDVETHAAATLRLHTAGGPIRLTYERASCTHGEPRSLAQLDGDRGSVRWDWLPYARDGRQRVIYRGDDAGQPAERVEEFDASTGPGWHERPLRFFVDGLRGGSSPSLVDEHAVFNFACIDAIYRTARTGEPASVSLQLPTAGEVSV